MVKPPLFHILKPMYHTDVLYESYFGKEFIDIIINSPFYSVDI